MDADAIEAADEEDSHHASSGVFQNVKHLNAVSHGCTLKVLCMAP